MNEEKIKNDYFAQLLFGIYRRINVKVDFVKLNEAKFSTEVIMFRGNDIYQRSFTRTMQKKYDHIFFMTFCAPEVFFINEKDKIIFDRADAVNNAILYFERYGVTIPEYFSGKNGYRILCKAIYTAISKIILPVIFECENNKDELDKRFDEVKAKVQALFSGIELGYLEGLNSVANDYEIIYDTEYHNDHTQYPDDLYAVPIDRSSIESQIILPFSEVRISIGIHPEDSERFTLERVIGNYQKYPFAGDEPFLDPFAGQAEEYAANNPRYTEESCFPLSNVVIPTQYFIPRYFYYITCINQNIIDRYNDDIMEDIRKTLLTSESGVVTNSSDEYVQERFESEKLDHNRLNTLLTKRAANDFRKKHHDDISEYYHHVMTYIEDMIRRIATADYSYAVRRDNDVEACQIFLKHFNIDYEKMIKTIEDDDCVQKGYEYIENAIFEFAHRLEKINNSFSPIKLSNEFAMFLPDEVVSHYNSIGEYIESGELAKAIKLKIELLSKKPDTGMKIELPKRDENGKIPLKETFRVLGDLEKAGNIYMEISNIIKQYHDSFKNIS